VTDWFVTNVRDARWGTHEKFGSAGSFEREPGDFEQLGINIRVLEPGQPNCLYHRENMQEDFLVLSGECLLLVDGEERPLKAWDFVHMPPDVDHVFVGAGDGPCTILMVGARSPDETLFYPRAEVAVKHGAAAEADTPDPSEAYAPFGERRIGERPASWDSLPWA
jgi:uncharacterized cupin superfamily protein